MNCNPQTQIPNLVSIIVPLYNAESYIARSLDSVYSQTYQELEIIVVDDGSRDSGPDICKEYASRNGKLHLFIQENRGPGTARNYGLQKAQGEYVFFLDADDYIDTKTLEVTVAALKETNADLVIVEEMNVRENNECSPNPHPGIPLELCKESTDYYFCTKEQYSQLLVNFRKYRNSARKIFYPCKGRLYKNSIISENQVSFPDNTFFMEDLNFQMQYCAVAQSLTLLKEPFYYYQLHDSPASITSRFSAEQFLPAAQLQYETTIELLIGANICTQQEAEQSASYAIIDDMLVNAIRSSRFITSDNYAEYYNNLKKVITAPLIQHLLKSYVPLVEQSKLIPFLMKLRAIHWLLYILKKKGTKRYRLQEQK